MYAQEVQKRVSWLAASAVFIIPIFVTPTFSLDPINVPKLWALSFIGFSLLGLLVNQIRVLISKENLKFTATVVAFITTLIIVMLVSDSPFTQQLFGVSGRNTGFLTYLCLSIVFLAISVAAQPSFAKKFIYFLGFALLLNIFYGLFQSFGIEPLNWQSAYSMVIGTMGNPNFLSSFLGIGTCFFLPFLFHDYFRTFAKLLIATSIIFAVYVILKSDSIQGFLIFLFGIAIVGYHLVKKFLNKYFFKFSYLVLTFIVVIVGGLGVLNKGPLSRLLYSSTVETRSWYWAAGLNMFKSQPFFGVGLDSYGDWYRFFRNENSVTKFGPSVVSNAAHNVFIDLLATAGLFAFLAYLIIIIWGFKAAYSLFKSNTSYDPFLIGIFAAWIAYLIQSVISINNIGLAIFGWVLPATLIAANRWRMELIQNTSKSKHQPRRMDFSSLFMSLGLVIGGVVGFFPFNYDTNFRHSLEVGQSNQIRSSALKWPQSSQSINMAANIFHQNMDQVPQLEIEMARKAVEFNSQNFESWNSLYVAKLTTVKERAHALAMMKKLDPYNSEIRKY